MGFRIGEGTSQPAVVGNQEPQGIETPSTPSLNPQDLLTPYAPAPRPGPAPRNVIAGGKPAGISLPPSTGTAQKPLTPRDQMSPEILGLLDRVGQRDVPAGMSRIVEAWTNSAVWA